MIAENNKRRTVTRADISQAAGQSDMFDFLIDFLPPDERKGLNTTGTTKKTGTSSRTSRKDRDTAADVDEKPPASSSRSGTAGATRAAAAAAKQAKPPHSSTMTAQALEDSLARYACLTPIHRSLTSRP